MQIDRLQTLATFLRTIPKGKFHLGAWMEGYDSYLHGFHELRPTVLKEMEKFKKKSKGEQLFIETGEFVETQLGEYPVVQPAKCATAGCAFGWAATIPEFQELGLKMINRNGSGEIFFKGVTDFSAACKFFDISANVASDLFSGTNYKYADDPKLVAKAIERLIKENQ